MTSSNPSDQFNRLEDDDLFLVNKELDDGSYETFSVKYSEVKAPAVGPDGPIGDDGATGATGMPGKDGTSIKIKGVFGSYDKLVQYYDNANLTRDNEGDIYVVEIDYMENAPTGELINQIGTPGNSYCNNPSSPSVSTCQNNVAYVYTIGAEGTMPGQNTAPGAFVRVGPLTGDKGEIGFPGPFYDGFVIEEDDSQFGFRLTDSGKTDGGQKYNDPDSNTPYHPGLNPTDLISDIRGATGPFFDEIIKHGTLLKKPNPDFDTTPGADSWDENAPDSIAYSDDSNSGLLSFDEAFEQAKAAENKDEVNLDYNPSYRYYNYVDIEFTSSNTPNPDVASDPFDILRHFRIKDLVGATGANTGSQGPRGETGPTGPYYDIIEENADNTDTIYKLRLQRF